MPTHVESAAVLGSVEHLPVFKTMGLLFLVVSDCLGPELPCYAEN